MQVCNLHLLENRLPRGTRRETCNLSRHAEVARGPRKLLWDLSRGATDPIPNF
ncbi:hypothetical protein HanRHA438_Chr11g0519281 [Helianthus annuus]|nr:hypothetical protein HanHA89_Chr11g0439611 [Helianthus annuus]KAJ0686673.1 hypothetical protein HanLR1_Chr11g0417391 [Helianthus annuus]KAJ0690483.1 hypothetical protein HanOQP8_Chr11g0418341 [Helianthus annuus]KAJ0872040.1 hypothetical protein HanRHA438_Chr11g0519281 [Helianthus annuus]